MIGSSVNVDRRRSQDLDLGWHWGSSPPLPSLSLLKGVRGYHPLEKFRNPRCLYVSFRAFLALKCLFRKASFVLNKTDFGLFKRTFLLSFPPNWGKFECVFVIWVCTYTHCIPSGYAYDVDGRHTPTPIQRKKPAFRANRQCCYLPHTTPRAAARLPRRRHVRVSI